jgi:hypothetical protein
MVYDWGIRVKYPLRGVESADALKVFDLFTIANDRSDVIGEF